MSTVIGIVNSGKVLIGADSYATNSDGEKRRIKCKKIFINGPYLIGYIGSIRSGQVLKPEYFKPPKNIFDFPDKMIEQFEKNGCLGRNSETGIYLMESNFLIGTSNGKLFEILVDFQMSEIKDYTCIGSGSSYAFGSLYTTEAWKDSKKRILTALEASGTYDMSTGPPYIIEEILK